MKYKKIIIGLLLIPSILSAKGAALDEDEKIIERNKQILMSLGLPAPNSGITIIKTKSMKIFPKAMRHDFKENEEQKKNGYIKKEDPRIKELMDFPHTAEFQYKKYADNFDSWSTHLRHTIPEIQMAYPFKGVPDNEMDEFIGVAPGGSFLKQKGWTGAVQFFVNNKVGSCAFNEDSLIESHAGIEIAEELITYEVNNKITLMNIRGTKGKGFLYDIQWFDNNFIRQLECANKHYSEETKNNVIELVRRIDSYQQ